MNKAMSIPAFLAMGMMIFVALGAATNDVEAAGYAVPIWEKGDYWTMQSSSLFGSMNMTQTVQEKTSITANGTSYEVYKTELKIDMLIIAATGTGYMRTSDIAMVKSEISTSFMGFSSTSTSLFNPPKVMFQWPITAGAKYTVNLLQIDTSSSMGSSDTTVTDYTYNYEVIGSESVTVKAGTFDCMKIMETETDEWGFDTINYYYYSDTVGFYVKMEPEDAMWGGGEELIAYSYSPGKNKDDGGKDGGIMGQLTTGYMPIVLIMIPVIIIIVAAVFMMKRSKAARQQLQMAPQPGQPQPGMAPGQPGPAPMYQEPGPYGAQPQPYQGYPPQPAPAPMQDPYAQPQPGYGYPQAQPAPAPAPYQDPYQQQQAYQQPPAQPQYDPYQQQQQQAYQQPPAQPQYDPYQQQGYQQPPQQRPPPYPPQQY